jgi:flagellar biosynthesis/type III secretory pathway M-ring protein FliF/YscJ
MKQGGTEGEVKVSMIPVLPDMLLMSPGAAGASAGGLFSPGGAMGEMVKSIAVGGLAVVSLGLVLLTAMRANKREDLPSASELVGIPPALHGDSDVVGEAGEADSVLAGVELTEDDLKVREMLDQISSLVGDQPDAAARLITRWVEEQD